MFNAHSVCIIDYHYVLIDLKIFIKYTINYMTLTLLHRRYQVKVSYLKSPRRSSQEKVLNTRMLRACVCVCISSFLDFKVEKNY